VILSFGRITVFAIVLFLRGMFKEELKGKRKYEIQQEYRNNKENP